MAAALFGVPAIAMAQSDTAAPTTEKSSMAKPKHHKLKIAHHTAHFRQGTTTGMSSGKSAGQARPGGETTTKKPAGY
jgi:hypothetical protein